MRLGFLNLARDSFQRAKAFQNGGLLGSLGDNMTALDEHFVFSKSIDHNPNTIFVCALLRLRRCNKEDEKPPAALSVS